MQSKIVKSFTEFVNEQLQTDSPIRIFCDMDGVLTDFDRGFKRLKANKNHRTPKEYEDKHGKNSIWPLIDHRKEYFWKRLPWTKDGRELWDYLDRYTPYILSAPSRSKYSKDGKMEWIKLNLRFSQRKYVKTPEEHEERPELRVILSNEKELFAKGANDILIDDKESNIEKWTKAGGTGILHNDSTDTIRILEEILAKLRGESEEPESEGDETPVNNAEDSENQEQVQEDVELVQLRQQYPEAKIKLIPGNDNTYTAEIDIVTQGKKTKNLAILKEPSSKEIAMEFIKDTLSKNYDEYY